MGGISKGISTRRIMTIPDTFTIDGTEYELIGYAHGYDGVKRAVIVRLSDGQEFRVPVKQIVSKL